eukprot:TRINITY_DN13457_c0_g1_i1.p1 TRINITY_DN13457_c0_g1~~TRINITY_DN13457_c0_g1_i1.p1  ORF type:complete len:1156 (+),score=265.20 TRINITY_DN13457_c0_g1_i1:76-3543(+)
MVAPASKSPSGDGDPLAAPREGAFLRLDISSGSGLRACGGHTYDSRPPSAAPVGKASTTPPPQSVKSGHTQKRLAADFVLSSKAGAQNRVDGVYDQLVPGPRAFTPTWGRESFLRFCRRPGSALDFCARAPTPATDMPRRPVSAAPPRTTAPCQQPQRPRTAPSRRPSARPTPPSAPPTPVTEADEPPPQPAAVCSPAADSEPEYSPETAAALSPRPRPTVASAPRPAAPFRKRKRPPAAAPLPSCIGVNVGDRMTAAGVYEQLVASVSKEEECWQSIELCCEATLKQAEAAAEGQDRPHPLLTGVAALLLTKVTSLFGRYRPLAERLLSILLEAVYVDFSSPVSHAASLGIINRAGTCRSGSQSSSGPCSEDGEPRGPGAEDAEDGTTPPGAAEPPQAAGASPAHLAAPPLEEHGYAVSEAGSTAMPTSPQRQRPRLPREPSQLRPAAELLDGRRFLRLHMFSESYKVIDHHFLQSEYRSAALQRTQQGHGRALTTIIRRWQIFACKRFFTGWLHFIRQRRLTSDRIKRSRESQQARRMKAILFLRWKVFALVSQRRSFAQRVQNNTRTLQDAMETLRGELATKEKELQRLRADKTRRQRKNDELLHIVDEEREGALQGRQRVKELEAQVSNLCDLAHTALDYAEGLTDSISRPAPALMDQAGAVERTRRGRQTAQIARDDGGAPATTAHLAVRDVEGLLLKWLSLLIPSSRLPQSLTAADFTDGRQLLTVAAKVAGCPPPGERFTASDAERAQAALDLMRDCGASVGLTPGDVLRPRSSRQAVAALCALFHRYAVFSPALAPNPSKRATDRSRTQDVEHVVKRLERLQQLTADGERWHHLGWAVGQYGRGLLAAGLTAPTAAQLPPCSLPQALVDLPAVGAFAQVSREGIPALLQRVEQLLREHAEQLRRVWLHYRMLSPQQTYGEAEWHLFMQDVRLGAKPLPRKTVDLIFRETVAAHAGESAGPVQGGISFEVWLRCLTQAAMLAGRSDDSGDHFQRVDAALSKHLLPLAPRLDADALLRAASDEGVLRVLMHHRDAVRRLFADYSGKPLRDLGTDDRMGIASAQRLLKDLHVPESDLSPAAVFYALTAAGGEAAAAPATDSITQQHFGGLLVAAAMVRLPNPLLPVFTRVGAFLREGVAALTSRPGKAKT